MLYSKVMEVLATIQFTPEVIAGLVGALLVLVFNYFPKLSEAYAGLEPAVKSYIMLGLLLVAEAIICALSYYGVIATEPPFSWIEALKVAFALVVANQSLYKLLPKSKVVQEAIKERDAAG